MEFACLLFPSFLFCYVRHRLNGTRLEKSFESVIHCIMEFACGIVSVNAVIIGVRILVRHKTGNIIDALNQYSDFALKYLLFGLALAVLLPYMERYCRDKIVIRFKGNLFGGGIYRIPQKSERFFVILFSVIMAGHHFIRIFDNAFWGDEGIAILAARQTWSAMLENVASHGHSPFHYAFVWLCCRVLGYSGAVYHFASTLPYFIIIVATLLFVWKWFGTETVLILTVLDTFLACAVTYNLEVRMYAWCQMFIFLTYLMAYQLYVTKKNIYYALMSVFALGAIYSHYFALAAVGLLYFALLLYCLKVAPKNVWRVVASGASVLLLFAPWIIFCYKTAGVVMSNYGIGEVKWHDCFEFIFHSKYSMPLLYSFFVLLIVHLIYEIGIVSVVKDKNQKTTVTISFSPQEWHISGYVIWVLSGAGAVFGTIIVSKVISSVVFPIIVLRYLYPSYIIIWLLLGISISKCKLNKLYTFVLIAVILVSCYPGYCDTVKRERANNKRLESTLSATVPEIGEEDFIYTDIVHFAWTVEKVYYPDTPKNLFGHAEWWGPIELPELEMTTDYWLFLGKPITEDITANLAMQHCAAELVVDRGYIGTGDVWIYRVIRMDGMVTE